MTTTEHPTPNTLALAETTTVHDEIARPSAAGSVTAEETGTTCCCATQDKASVTGHGRQQEEVYTVLTGSPTLGTDPTTRTEAGSATDGGACCGAAPGNSGCC